MNLSHATLRPGAIVHHESSEEHMANLSPVEEATSSSGIDTSIRITTDSGERTRRIANANSGGSMREALDDYYDLKTLDAEQVGDEKLRQQPNLVSRYYDVVTQFYEYAWGQSFHFSSRRRGESLPVSQGRQEEGVGRLLALKPGMRVADVGCGVGGPLVTIGKATGASITGLNFNDHQIARGEQLVRSAGLDGTCGFLLANFMDVPLEDGHFDAIYSIEAICHAPDTRLLFDELYRLLKPGGEIAAIDWCLTARFDEDDCTHRDIRERIEFANATPDLLTTQQQLDAMKSAGFEILSATDQAAESEPSTPWYMALQGRDVSLASLARIPAGRRLTAGVTALLEKVRIAPPGTSEASALLNVAADSLVEAGEAGIFTPMFLVHARKPSA
jgi:sterol 24-C-methyltransferase